MEPKPDKLIPALIGGTIIAGLSSVPIINFINCFCCAGVIIGGYFSVYFYHRNLRQFDLPLTYGDGALVGIMAGIFGVLFSYALNLLFGTNVDQVMDQMMSMMDTVPPEVEDMVELLKANQGKLMLASMAMGLVIDIIFGMLGGILGVSMLNKKR